MKISKQMNYNNLTKIRKYIFVCRLAERQCTCTGVWGYPANVAKVCTFYVELKNGRGNLQSKSSLVNIRAGRSWHLSPPQANIPQSCWGQQCHQSYAIYTGIIEGHKQMGGIKVVVFIHTKQQIIINFPTHDNYLREINFQFYRH